MAALGTPEFEADETGELFAYTGRPTDVGGEFDALVEWESQKRQLPLVVVAGVGPALVGRNWVRAIRIDWDRILHPPNADAASKMDPFKDVFELGAIKIAGSRSAVVVWKALSCFVRAPTSWINFIRGRLLAMGRWRDGDGAMGGDFWRRGSGAGD